MKIKSFEEIVENIKNNPEPKQTGVVYGDDFEAWLKTRKQHRRKPKEITCPGCKGGSCMDCKNWGSR
jgi:hypothetical protein